MTRTEHLQLYRWVPEDFVNLDQVNANFDALETVGGNYNTAAETLRHHLAHDAQAQHHAGRSLLRRKNLLSVDLSKKEGEVQSLEQLQNVDGTPILVPSIQPAFTEQTQALTVFASAAGTLCNFTPSGYGSLASVTLPAPESGMKAVSVRITRGERVLYESAPMDFAASAQKTVPLQCEIIAGCTYALQLRRTTIEGISDWAFPAGTCAFTTAGSTYPNGSFTTRAFAFERGSVFDLWVYYTGEPPALARSMDGGIWHPMTPAETAAGFALDDSVCSVRRYRLTDLAGHTMRLRFTLSSTSTRVKDCCGCLL